MSNDIPDGDILIHCGDFTKIGAIDEVKKFSLFLESIRHKFKFIIVIAGSLNHKLSLFNYSTFGNKGNHELSFDKNCL